MEWVASTLHTTSEHGVSSITTADAHTSAASSRLNWHPRRFKWTHPFSQKTKSGLCAYAITFQTQSTNVSGNGAAVIFRVVQEAGISKCLWKFCSCYQLTWCHIPGHSNFFGLSWLNEHDCAGISSVCHFIPEDAVDVIATPDYGHTSVYHNS
jgi:hypothetical protein